MSVKKASTRPSKVRVLGKTVSISYVPAGDITLRDSPDDKDVGVGRNDPDKQAIYVEDGQPLESEQDTVLHEIIHILEAYMAIRLSETAVRKLATGLIAVIKDNPTFLPYLRARNAAKKHSLSGDNKDTN